MTNSASSSLTQCDRFVSVPKGWYYACRAVDIDRGPIGLEVGATKFVVYRSISGQPVALKRQCAHMNADLACGNVVDGHLVCPLHGWEYADDGKCVRIPVDSEIPAFARLAKFETVEFNGHVAIFNAGKSDFPFPVFDGKSFDDLSPAKPFDFFLDVPWYMVSANAFDLQHFRTAHDRTLVRSTNDPDPSPFARRITGVFGVDGNSFRDRVTRTFSGPQVTMTITAWTGTTILVTASFRKTTSYGLVFVRPLGESRTHVRVINWISPRRSSLARALIDPLDRFIRRRFIRAFLKEDAVRGIGVQYNPSTLIDADQVLREYLDWLAEITS